MFCFFRSLVGSKRSPESSDEVLWGARGRGLQRQDQPGLGMEGQGGQGEPLQEATLQRDSDPHPPTPSLAPGVPVTSALARESQKERVSLSEERKWRAREEDDDEEAEEEEEEDEEEEEGEEEGEEEEEEEEEGEEEDEEEEEEEEEEEDGDEEVVAGGPTGATGIADRAPVTQALRQAPAAPENEPEASSREQQQERTGDGDPRPASSTVGGAAWYHLLDLYKQLQKSAMAKFLQESLARKEKEAEEEEKKNEAGASELSDPGASGFQPQPQTSFRSKEKAGFMKSELKKLLEAQGKSGLWKTASQEHEERLAQLESCLAGSSGMGLQAGGEGSSPPVSQECWRARDQGPRTQRCFPPPEGPHGYQAGALGTEHVLPEEMEELGLWASK